VPDLKALLLLAGGRLEPGDLLLDGAQVILSFLNPSLVSLELAGYALQLLLQVAGVSAQAVDLAE
jgi:hypothetical protein